MQPLQLPEQPDLRGHTTEPSANFMRQAARHARNYQQQQVSEPEEAVSRIEQNPLVPPAPPEPTLYEAPADPPMPIPPRNKLHLSSKAFVAIGFAAILIIGGIGLGGYKLLNTKHVDRPAQKTATPTKKIAKAKKPKLVPKKKKPVVAKKVIKPTEQVVKTPVKTSSGSKSSVSSTTTKSQQTPSPTACTKSGGYTSCYHYAGAAQYVTATGASVKLSQANPRLSSHDYHSLMEMAVESADGKQIVEVGWTVDRTMGYTSPHLFVYHWVNGQTSCYNGCGFVQVSGSVYPGQAVTVGATGSYSIRYSGGQWQIWYNNIEVGYFPASLWGGTYTKLGLVQVFGEVSASSAKPCTQMGNGIFGSHAGSAQISSFSLIGATTAAKLYSYVSNTSSSYYNYGAATATSLRIGGPGAC